MRIRALALLATFALGVAVAGCGDNKSPEVDAAPCVPVDDGNDCTEDRCDGDFVVHQPLDEGTECAAGVCDGDGACVGCLEDADCDAPQICDEPNHTCVDPTCDDDEQNGTETDVDCGGSCAPAQQCADGLHCAVPADCQSGVCDGTMCLAPRCGDGVQQTGEACDDGNETNGDGCDDGAGGTCRPTGCGNGVVSGTEACDDGNAMNGDGCDNNCTATACGNGILTGTEACDDDDTDDGDGCSATCAVEAGFTCTGLPSTCTTTCGDGIRAGAEACDDVAPAENGDGCSATCTIEPGFSCTGSPSVCTTTCGDGVRAGAEACDDGGVTAGDGCSGLCTVEPGYTCTGSPSMCSTTCGDGIRAGVEACDDAPPAESGDGCSQFCLIETGYTCTGQPSVCNTTCGDGIRAGAEACDDAPPAENGDGCSATCTVETGFTCTGTAPTVCTTTCGDGIRAGAEACDDAPPAENGDGCSATCTTETGYTCVGTAPSVCSTTCGDGVRAGAEQCDDAPPAENGDGCSATCTTETGFTCTGSAPSVCTTTCGDGVRAGAEACDDGNTTAGDGCTTCTTDTGYTCTGTAPSVCTTTCGDGIRAGAEQCDDAPPADNGDGCSATCTTEFGYTCTGTAPSVCTTTCGDGLRAGAEACDDAPPAENGDGCSATCTLEPGFGCSGVSPTVCSPTCGDGQIVAGEQCDDSNVMSGDGCSATCQTEPGYTCLGQPSVCSAGCGDGIVAGTEQCDDGGNTDGDGCSGSCNVEFGYTCSGSPSNCVATCGDGIRAASEQCDDGGNAPGDGCSIVCTTELGWSCSGNQPTTCTAVCGDGIRVGAETCDQGGGNVTPGDGCSATCQTEVGYTCTGTPSICATTCGDGVIAGAETCDQGGGNVTPGDGCSATCTVEIGFTCAGVPSLCAPICGDGIRTGGETCDQGGGNITPGDGCSATCATELGWTCTGTPSTCAPICGDGLQLGAEQCDDGCLAGTPNVCEAADNGDGCSQTCTLECGNGALTGTEQCDDGNRNNGDGCSATCAFEFVCSAGETLVQIRSTDVPKTIADNAPAVDSVVNVPVASQGAVRRVFVGIGRVDHLFTGDVTLALIGPSQRLRLLADRRGSSGDNFVTTRFDDAATATIASGTPPYSGAFRPEQTISDLAGFANLNAAGTWTLRSQDIAGGVAGVLNGWTLGLCVDAAARCGNGALDAGEACDDGNAVAGDGCSMACQIEAGATCTGSPSSCGATCGDGIVAVGETCDDGNTIANDGCSASCAVEIVCGAGETPLVLRSTDVPKNIPEVNTAGVQSTIAVVAPGAVRKVIVAFSQVNHGNDGHLDTFLVSPAGTVRELSTDNPGTGTGVNFTSTIFNDASATLITGITAAQNPYRGVFRPEQSLSTTAGTDFLNQPPNGTWSLRLSDDTVGTLGSLEAWTLALCVDTGAICGNGVVNTGETCDDGNTTANDGCNSLCATETGFTCTGAPSICVPTCGDGAVVASEQCDDGGTVPGDGCSATCTVELTCAAGETPVVVRSLDVPKAIPDATVAGATSVVNLATPGAIRKLVVTFGQITHGTVTHLDTFLISPLGVTRELSTDNPGTGTGVNFTSTIFNDASATLITGITAAQNPYRGVFRPEQSLTTTAGTDFLNAPAAGAWTLRVADDTSGTTGTLNSWTLAACVDTAAVCGNGTVDTGEQCDDGNTTPGDGCSLACRTEFGFACTGSPSTCSASCAAGLTPVFLTNSTPTPLADTSGGTLSTINVPVIGVVRSVIPIINVNHTSTAQLDIFLSSPFGVQRDLSSDNAGGTGVNYTGTAFADGAPTAITAGTAPYSGAFIPEQTISTAAPAGFGNQTATGAWTLRIADDTAGTTGTLTSWSLLLCVDPAVTSVCGNGIVELAETCDDGNTTAGDGCAATCDVELTCATGSPVLVRGTGLPLIIPDGVAAGVTSPAGVSALGTVTKAVVLIGALSHQFDGDVTLALSSPAGTSVALSTNTGGGGDDFVSTLFDDAATTAIGSGAAPFRGRFRPASALTAFNTQAATGVWTLRVADTANIDAGLLGAWTLGLCVQ